MSLYNYVPDKQALVYAMVEEVVAELRLPEPTGDWRADMHSLAHEQRDLLQRHPWLITESSHLQPLGPGVLGPIEWALGVLEPTGLSVRQQLEAFAMFNWFVGTMVRGELATRAAPPPDSDQVRTQAKELGELLATGRYPRFAAAITQSGPPDPDDERLHFDVLLDRILDGLIGVRGGRAPGRPISDADHCRSSPRLVHVRQRVRRGSTEKQQAGLATLPAGSKVIGRGFYQTQPATARAAA